MLLPLDDGQGFLLATIVMPEFRIDGASITVWLRVKPRSGRDHLALDPHGDLRLELHAPAVEGQANEACVKFFARALRLPQSCVVILAGKKSRRKLVRITGPSAEETLARLNTLAGPKSGQGTS